MGVWVTLQGAWVAFLMLIVVLSAAFLNYDWLATVWLFASSLAGRIPVAGLAGWLG